MTIRTSTEMLGIFSTDTYAPYSDGAFNNYDFDYLEETEGITFQQALNKVIMPVAEELLEDALDPVISCKVKAVEVVNPREYNFTTDNTIVDISFNGNDFKKLKANAVKDPAFPKYLKDNYSSYSGFISFMADNLEKFNEQDLEEQFCQVVSFYISDSEKENYQHKFWYELDEKLYDEYQYLWMDDEDYYGESKSRNISKPMVKKLKEYYTRDTGTDIDSQELARAICSQAGGGFNVDDVEQAVYQLIAICENEYNFDFYREFLEALARAFGCA